MTHGRRGRELAKLEFAAAIVGIGIAAITWIAQPGWFGPMFTNPSGNRELSGLAGIALVGVAVGGMIIGSIWMIRVLRDNPEPDQRAWRYRDRD